MGGGQEIQTLAAVSSSNKMATYGDISSYLNISVDTNKCLTKSQIKNSVKSGYTLTITDDSSYADNQLVPLSKLTFNSSTGEIGEDEYEDIVSPVANYNMVIYTSTSGAWPTIKLYFRYKNGRYGFFSLPGGSSMPNSTIKRNVNYRLLPYDYENEITAFRVVDSSDRVDGLSGASVSVASYTSNNASDVPSEKWQGVRASTSVWTNFDKTIYGNYLWQFKVSMSK